MEIKRKIEAQFDNVYVDVARKNVLAYVQHYSEFLTWDTSSIDKSKQWNRQSATVWVCFEEAGLPKNICFTTRKVISEFNNKGGFVCE